MVAGDLAVVGAALAIGYAYQILMERRDAKLEKQANCRHEWGETKYLAGLGYRHCRECGKQQNRDPDGNWTDQ